MSKVILNGYILVPQSELELIKTALIDHTKLTLKESGCLIFSVNEHSENPLRFDVYEEFTDKAAFEQHQKRVKASYWEKITANVERHYQIVE